MLYALISAAASGSVRATPGRTAHVRRRVASAAHGLATPRPVRRDKGRKIIITGVVDRVTKDLGEVNVLIKPQNAKRFSIDRVAYKVSNDDMGQAAAARPGEPIRAGGCVTGMLGHVFVEPCDD